MPNLYDATPSSLRRVIGTARFIHQQAAQTLQPMPAPAFRTPKAAALTKSFFARLPEEPDDVKLTGGTRSLHRRLLALNVGGSLLSGRVRA